MVRREFAPGEEPAVYTADICAEVGHEHCKGMDTTIEGYEGSPVFCYAIGYSRGRISPFSVLQASRLDELACSESQIHGGTNALLLANRM